VRRDQILRRGIGVAIAAAAVAAHLTGGAFAQELIAEAAILALFALSLDLLARCGLISFGHAGFLGIGGYVFGGLTVIAGWSPWMALLVAVGAGIAAAVVTGVLAVRTAGAFFIMVTLALAEMFYAWAFRAKTFNGADGMGGVPRIDLRAVGIDLDAPATFALAMIVLCILAWIVLEFVAASPFGRTLEAIRQNAGRVAALGGRVFSYRLAAYTASGALASFAGALKVQHTNFITPELAHWLVSGDVLIAVVIGGIGSLVGGVIGAVILVGLRELLSGLVGHWHLVLGGIFIVVALLLPNGIIGALQRIGRGRPARKEKVAAALGEEPT
jgi:branched-chain amino acid transport system permease protein